MSSASSERRPRRPVASPNCAVHICTPAAPPAPAPRRRRPLPAHPPRCARRTRQDRRQLAALETWPWLHAFVQTTLGRLALILVFTGFMKVDAREVLVERLDRPDAADVLSAHRRAVFMVAALAWTMVQLPIITDPMIMDPIPRARTAQPRRLLRGHAGPRRRAFLLWPLAVGLLAWTIGYAYIRLVQRYPEVADRTPAAQRFDDPAHGVHGAAGLIGGVAWVVIASFAMALSHYIWFFGYSIIEPKQKDGSPPQIRPEYWRYFWATNRCPIGKGPAYLDRIEAKNAAELATVQLKGLKLLMWATVLSLVRDRLHQDVLRLAERVAVIRLLAAGRVDPQLHDGAGSERRGDAFPWAIALGRDRSRTFY